MDKLLLHPSTEHQLHALMGGKPHAVIISGGTGTGKQTVAETLMAAVLGPKTAQSESYILRVSPEKGSIGIDQVRKIRDFLSRKTTGNDTIRRIILLLEAHTMQQEAQNALLKTLEEPPADTMIILTTTDMTALRYTIRSRSQQLLVLPVHEDAAMDFFKRKGYGEAAIRTAYHMGDGRVGLLSALLEQDDGHELVEAIQTAKKLLNMPTYERLNQVDALSKQKEQLPLLFEGLERVVSSGLRQSANKADASQARKFYELRKLVHESRESLDKNVNAKLLLTRLCMEM